MRKYQDLTEREIWKELLRFFNNKYLSAAIMASLDSGLVELLTNSFTNKDFLNYANEYELEINSKKLQILYIENKIAPYLANINDIKSAHNLLSKIDNLNISIDKIDNYFNKYKDVDKAYEAMDLSGVGYGDESDDLSDVTLEVDTSNLKSVCQEWESKITSIDLSSIDVTSIFAPLTNSSIGTAYIPSLKTALDKVESMILSTSRAIKEAANSQEEVDDQYKKRNKSYSDYSDDGKKDDKKDDDKDDDKNDDKQNEDEETKDNDKEDLKVNTDFVSRIEKLDSDSYISFMTALGSISNGELLAYVVDTKYASKLKQALLSSPNISEDLKKIISEMDENELQVTLQSILTNEKILSDYSKSIIYTYTEELAKSTNIDVLKVSKEAQFFNNVDDFFNTIDALVKSDNLQDNLLTIYDGSSPVTSLSEESTNFVRIAVDKLSEKENVKYDELLTNKAHLNTIKESLTDLSKSLAYFRTVNTMGIEAAQLLLSNALK